MRFQVLMVVRVTAEIEAPSQAEAERLADLLAVRDGSALALLLKDGAAPQQLVPAMVDDVEVADVEEAS